MFTTKWRKKSLRKVDIVELKKNHNNISHLLIHKKYFNFEDVDYTYESGLTNG